MASSGRSFTRLLVGGLAQYLAEHDVAEWDDFGSGTAYTSASEWPVFLGPDMPSTPDPIVVLTPGVTSYLRADIMQNVQIRVRGTAGVDEDEVADRAQRIMDVLYPNGFPLVHAQFGEIRVGAVLPGDRLPLSRDENRRHGIVQNVRIRARRPRPV